MTGARRPAAAARGTRTEPEGPGNVLAPECRVQSRTRRRAERPSSESGRRRQSRRLRQNFQSAEGPLRPLISHKGSRATALTGGPRKRADTERPPVAVPRTTRAGQCSWSERAVSPEAITRHTGQAWGWPAHWL